MIKPVASSLSMLFLAGSSLLLFFMLLGGTRYSIPLNQLFWLQFDTNSINSPNNIPNPVRWTYYNYCGVDSNGHNIDCSSNKAAFPFTPQDAFNTQDGIPRSFIVHRNSYYYMTRISYGFLIAVLFFTLMALLFTIIACFSAIGAGLVSFLAFFAFALAAIAVSLATAAFVKARHELNQDNMNAHLGVKMMAFGWTVVALLFLTWILSTAACLVGAKNKKRQHQREEVNVYDHEKSGGFFSRRRKSSSAAVPIDSTIDYHKSATSGNTHKPALFFWNNNKRNNNPNMQKEYASSFERIDAPHPVQPAPVANNNVAAANPPVGAGSQVPAQTSRSNPMVAGFFKNNKRRTDQAYAPDVVPLH